MKKIVLLNAHPRKDSLCDALSTVYAEAARAAGGEVRILTLRELRFDPVADPHACTELEEDLKQAQETILWSDHLCIVFPLWWAALPALAKGFVDRTFTKGWAFEFPENGWPHGLLKGRSARIIHTMSAPKFYNQWIVGNPQIKMLKKGVLEFCGFHPVKVTAFAGIRSTCSKVPRFLATTRELAEKDAACRSA